MTGTVVHERNTVIAMWVRSDSFESIHAAMWSVFENEATQAPRGEETAPPQIFLI